MAAEVVAEWHNAQSLVATLGIAGMLMKDSHLEANRDIDHALRSVRRLAEDLGQVGEGGRELPWKTSTWRMRQATASSFRYVLYHILRLVRGDGRGWPYLTGH